MVGIARYDASALTAKLVEVQTIHDPWQTMFRSRLSYAPAGAQYFAVQEQDSISELLEDGSGVARIHHASWSGNISKALQLLVYTIGLACAASKLEVVRISALERTLVDPLAKALSLQPKPLRLQSRSCCGMFMRACGNELPSSTLPPGFKLRALLPTDAPILDARWQYRSATSMQMIEDMLQGDTAGNIGVEDENGVLAGCASPALEPLSS